MPYFNIVAATNENTVVTEYEPVKTRSDSYQSEAALEREFIRLLTEQGYEYLPIHSEKELVANLRRKLESLNGIQFSDDEWSRFFTESLANPNEHIAEKTRKVQEDFVQVLRRDDGSTKNITGIILTKLDGTAKGGIAVAIQSELGIPVKYIGIGERIDDLQKFNADDFVNALFHVQK